MMLNVYISNRKSIYSFTHFSAVPYKIFNYKAVRGFKDIQQSFIQQINCIAGFWQIVFVPHITTRYLSFSTGRKAGEYILNPFGNSCFGTGSLFSPSEIHSMRLSRSALIQKKECA